MKPGGPGGPGNPALPSRPGLPSRPASPFSPWIPSRPLKKTNIHIDTLHGFRWPVSRLAPLASLPLGPRGPDVPWGPSGPGGASEPGLARDAHLAPVPLREDGGQAHDDALHQGLVTPTLASAGPAEDDLSLGDPVWPRRDHSRAGRTRRSGGSHGASDRLARRSLASQHYYWPLTLTPHSPVAPLVPALPCDLCCAQSASHCSCPRGWPPEAAPRPPRTWAKWQSANQRMRL